MTHVTTDLDNKTPLLSNGFYDVLNNIVKLGLPGAGALYFTLSKIWDLAYGEEVVGTLAAVAIFLGVLLKVSDASYARTSADKDGVIDVYPTENGLTLSPLSLNAQAGVLSGKNLLTIKVNPIAPPRDI